MTTLPKAGRTTGAPVAALWAALAWLLVVAVALPVSAKAAERGVVSDLTWATSAGDQDRTAAALKDVGAGWVRLNANWADAEPTQGQYSGWWLDHYDRAVELARASGARIVLLSYQSPFWASGSTNMETPPADPADFARFMGFLAARYKGKVEAYEVWNEENLARFWSTGPDPARYVELLKATHAAIKLADPDAKVVFGGLSTNDYQFVERAYDAGAQGHFDVMSVHPYTCDKPPELIERSLDGRMTRASFQAYREVRDSMLARGDDKPIWFTELGWSTTTGSCGVSEATQADYLTRAYRLIEQDPYVQIALWHNLRNNYWDFDWDTIEARYGLLRTDFSPKPAYNALKHAGLTITETSTDPPLSITPAPAVSAPSAGGSLSTPEVFTISFSRSPTLCAVIKGTITSAGPARYRGIARILIRKRVAASRRIHGQADERGAVLRVAFSTKAVTAATRAARRAHRRPVLEIEVRGLRKGAGRDRLRRKLALPGPGCR